MKNFMKAMAAILTVATFATVPSMAEVSAAATAATEAQNSVSVDSFYGADINETGASLGLEKVQTQGENDAYLTLYENADIMIGGRDGIIVNITLFTDSYEMYGVKVGMTAEEAKAALTAHGITYTEGEIAELDTKTIDFKIPGHEDATGYFEIDDDKICDAHIETAADVVEEEIENTSKATEPVSATGYIKMTGKANLRKSPDKESSSLKVIAKGTKLKYTATATDARGVTWYKVKDGKKTGWVSSKNTTKIKKSEYQSKATSPKKAHGYIELTGQCNVRKKPDKNSKTLDIFAEGSVLEYTATAKDSRGVKWYKVTADGVTGWISSKNANKVD